MPSRKNSLNCIIHALIRAGDLEGFSKIARKAIEIVDERGRTRIILLCIRCRRIEFFQPLFKAFPSSGINILEKIWKSKEFYFASAAIKIELFKAFTALKPFDYRIHGTASKFLMFARPKKDFELLKFFHDHKMSFYRTRINREAYEQLNEDHGHEPSHYNIFDFVVSYQPRLIDDVFCLQVDWLSSDTFSWRVLLHSIMDGQIESVKGLMKYGLNVNSTGCRTPLLLAAVAGSKYNIAKFLISKGAKLEARTQYNSTAFTRAAKNCDISMLEILIKAGAKTENQGALSMAITHNRSCDEQHQLECVKFLVENVGLKQQIVKEDLLYTALSLKKYAIFDYLVQICDDERAIGNTTCSLINSDQRLPFEILKKHNKLYINYVDRLNCSPIMEAVKKSISWVNRVVQCGADVNIRCGETGRTPLGYATISGRDEMISLLLDHGAQVDMLDKRGNTALAEAVTGGALCGYWTLDGSIIRRFAVLDTLLHAGSDPDLVKNKAGNYCDYLLKFQSI